MDWGTDPGRTRRVWIITLGLVAIVGMALTVVLAINPADTADPTILAPVVGSAVGALAAIAAISHHEDRRDRPPDASGSSTALPEVPAPSPPPEPPVEP